MLAKQLDKTLSITYPTLFIPIFIAEGFALLWLVCVHIGNQVFGLDWDSD